MSIDPPETPGSPGSPGSPSSPEPREPHDPRDPQGLDAPPDAPRDAERHDPAAPAEEAVPQVGRLATTNTVTGAAAPQAPPPMVEVPGRTPNAGRSPGAAPSSRPRASETTRQLLKGSALHLVLTAAGLALFLPFVYMLLTSVKDLSQVGLPSWIPSEVVTTDAGQFGEEQLDRLHALLASPDGQAEAWLAERFGNDTEPDATAASTVLNKLINDGPLAEAEPGVDAAAPADPAAEEAPPTDLRALDPFDPAVLGLTGGVPEGLAEARAAAQEAPGDLMAARKLRAHQLAAAFPGIAPAPQAFRWHNYLQVFRDIPFGRFYMNSLFVAAWVTFLQLFTSSMAAFSFSRLKWRGRDQVFLLYLATMMLPGLVLMIPNYQIMISLGLVDTLIGLILPAAFTAFGTFLLRQFMLGIPSSLDEAAEIDGASKWRVYWDVILPLSRPGLVTLAIFTFMGTYNSFFWPLVMLKSEHRYTLPIGILAFDTSAGQQTNLMMAAITMTVVPMIVVFVLLQKQLVKGIQLGAVKG